jgi:hypothetical protein
MTSGGFRSREPDYGKRPPPELRWLPWALVAILVLLVLAVAIKAL